MKKDTLLLIISLFAVFGFAIAAYSLYYHYSSGLGWCDISNTFSCDVVNRGEYSEIFGIPVAVFGIVGYLSIFLFACILRKESAAHAKVLFLALSFIGVLFSAYLTYIEAFVLFTFCILCLVSAGLMLSIFALSVQFVGK